MFRATQCSSSGESIVSIHHLVYVSLCVGGRLVCRSEISSLTCIPDSHLHTVIYTRWRIDTTDSPDDEHWVARNMYRSEINTLKKCVQLVIDKNCTEMHGQQNISRCQLASNSAYEYFKQSCWEGVSIVQIGSVTVTGRACSSLYPYFDRSGWNSLTGVLQLKLLCSWI